MVRMVLDKSTLPTRSARIYVIHVEDEMKETQWVVCGKSVRGLIVSRID